MARMSRMASAEGEEANRKCIADWVEIGVAAYSRSAFFIHTRSAREGEGGRETHGWDTPHDEEDEDEERRYAISEKALAKEGHDNEEDGPSESEAASSPHRAVPPVSSSSSSVLLVWFFFSSSSAFDAMRVGCEEGGKGGQRKGNGSSGTLPIPANPFSSILHSSFLSLAAAFGFSDGDGEEPRPHTLVKNASHGAGGTIGGHAGPLCGASVTPSPLSSASIGFVIVEGEREGGGVILPMSLCWLSILSAAVPMVFSYDTHDSGNHRK